MMAEENYFEFHLNCAIYKCTTTTNGSEINMLIEIEKWQETDPDIVNFLALERCIYLSIREWADRSRKLYVDVRNCGIDDVCKLQDSLSNMFNIIVLIKKEWRFINA